MTGRKHVAVLAAIWVLPSALLLALATWVYTDYRITTPPRLEAQARTALMTVLRSALQGDGSAPSPLPWTGPRTPR